MLTKKLNNIKSGQQKFYGVMLAIVFILLAFLYKFFPGDNGADSLQPIMEYVNSSGTPIEIYRGSITKISSQSITLANGSKSGDFSLSEQYPAKFVNSRDKPIEPKAGDYVLYLSVAELSSKEKYVSKVVIDTTRLN